MSSTSGDDLFDISGYTISLTIANDDIKLSAIFPGRQNIATQGTISYGSPLLAEGKKIGDILVTGMKGVDQSATDSIILNNHTWSAVISAYYQPSVAFTILHQTQADVSFALDIRQPSYLYVVLITNVGAIARIVNGATYIGDVTDINGNISGRVYRIKTISSPCTQGTEIKLGTTYTINGLSVELLSINYLPTPGWAGIKIQGTEYDIRVGESKDIPDGTLKLYKLLDFGVCIDITSPVVTPPITPPITQPTLPPFPTDPGCIWPVFQWNFNYIYKILEFIGCHIKQIIAILGWFKDVVVASFDYVMLFILYFVSLKWLTDFIAKFFDELDTWLSAKFGIDKNKPFLEELVKKVWGIVTAGASEAFIEGKRRLQ